MARTDVLRSFKVDQSGVHVNFDDGSGTVYADWDDLRAQVESCDTDPDLIQKMLLKCALSKDPDPAAALNWMLHRSFTVNLADDTPVSIGEVVPPVTP